MNNIENIYNLAINLFKESNYDESEKYIKEILEIVPNNSDVLNFYGRLKQFKGQINESIEILNKSIEIDNNNYMAHYNIALAYCIHKNIDMVKTHFNKFIEYIEDVYVDTLYSGANKNISNNEKKKFIVFSKLSMNEKFDIDKKFVVKYKKYLDF